VQEDVLKALMEFHREVVLPDMQRVVKEAVEGSERSLRNEMYSIADSTYLRFDRIESELAAVKGGLTRVESEVAELKVRMSRVEARLGNVEARLGNVEARLGNVESRLADVESELQSVKSSLTQVEARVSALEIRLAGVDEKIDQLAPQSGLVEIRQQITAMNRRITEIEQR